MPKVVRFVSSQSGKEVDADEAYKVRISGNGDYFEADLTADEAKAVISTVKAEKRTPRGRKPAEAKA